MRTGPALILLASIAAACSRPSAEPAVCAYSSDCAYSESCVDGLCEPDPLRPQRRDAEVVIADGGMLSDAAAPDARTTGPDAGTCAAATIRDAGSYCTISEAVTAASPGSVIQLSASRYVERVRIDRAVTLRGAGAPGTTIAAPGAGGAAVLTVTSSGALVELLAIDAGGAVGVEIQRGATLRSVSVSGAANAGVLITGGAGTVNLASVAVEGTARSSPGATGEDDGAGVRALAGAIVILGSATIRSSAGAGIVSHGARIEAHQTELSGNGSGLLADQGAEVTVDLGSQIRGNTRFGLRAIGGRFTMLNSSSLDTGPTGATDAHGLILESMTSADVVGNNFSGNQGFGIFCGASTVPVRCSPNMFGVNARGSTNCTGCP